MYLISHRPPLVVLFLQEESDVRSDLYSAAAARLPRRLPSLAHMSESLTLCAVFLLVRFRRLADLVSDRSCFGLLRV